MSAMHLEIDPPGCLLRAASNGVEILRYNGGDDTPPVCSPKPFFHPVRTLAGRDVCVAAPDDHPWHAGVWLSFPGVDGVNFWGGPTYVRDQGYLELDNHGSITHLRWKESSANAAVEELEWRDAQGAVLLHETRQIGVTIDPQDQAWTLLLESRLRNAAGQDLRLTSPGSAGRPEGGYAGLAWRGTDDFSEFIGADDTIPNGGTFASLGLRTRDDVIMLISQTCTDPQHPNRWFARSTPYPLLACSPVFEKEIILAPETRLNLCYSLRISDNPTQ